MTFEDLINSLAQNRFKNFEEFKKTVLKKTGSDDFDYDDLSASELKSKAVLGEIEEQNFSSAKYNISLKTMLRGFLTISELESYSNSSAHEIFWSNMAGELNDKDAETLVSFLNEYYQLRYQRVPTTWTLNFALKNEVAWKAYAKDFFDEWMPPVDLLNALSHVPEIKKRHLPLMNKVFGEAFTKLYLKHKSLVDKTPRKQNFIDELDRLQFEEKNFLDAFTFELKKLTADFGEDQHDFYCLSNALEKDGFREAATKLFNSMLENKERYAHPHVNYNSNEFIRKRFPELVKKLKETLFLDFSDERLWEISNMSFKQRRILRQIALDSDLREQNIVFLYPTLIRDIVKELPENIEQVKKTIELFYKLNGRPDTYASSYNAYYPSVLVPIVKTNAPDWMCEIIPLAVNAGVVSADNLGSVKNLFDACKTWQINPSIWKKEAQAIGKMPLEARMVAGAIFADMRRHQDSEKPRSKLKDLFWLEMKKAQDMGWKQAVRHYCRDCPATRGRVLSLYHSELSDKMQYNLRACVHFGDLISVDTQQLNKNFEIFEKRFHHSKEEILVENGSSVNLNGTSVLMLRCITNLHKLFPSEELFTKYSNAAKDFSIRQALEWMPSGLSEEKYSSFATFLQKNLFYDDGTGNYVLRPLEQLEKISRIWSRLTPQQEQFNCEKILSLTYTQQTRKLIERNFRSYLEHDIKLSDDLRLYQKFLIITAKPNSQETVDSLLALNRTEALQKIAQKLDQQSSEDEDSLSFEKRALVDFIVGNNANINDFERDQLAQLSSSSIFHFRSQNYQKIMCDLMDLVSKDPEAGKLFRKNYLDMTSDTTHSTNEKVLNIRETFQTNKDWVVPSAIKTMLCFGNDYERYLNKIDKFNKYVQKQIQNKNPDYSGADIINVHDALYWLPENVQEKDQNIFMELIDKHLFYTDDNGNKRHRSFSEFETIAKFWCHLKPEERKSSYKDLLALVHAKKYTQAKYDVFAEEAARWGVTEFEYPRYEQIYEQGLQVPELVDSSITFSSDDLTGRFLPRDDPRIGFFGKWTDCCQHFNGAGRSCAISSIRDPFSQLFVVENSAGRIVAGSWVWDSKIKKGDSYYKAFCFDNIEAIGDYKFSQKVIDVYKKTLPYLAEQNYAKVTVGLGYQDGKLNEFLDDNDPIPLNKNYSGYTDSYSQKVMMNNPKASAVDYSQGDIYITGALETEIPSMESVYNICFIEGDRRLQIPTEDPQGLLLKDKGVVVGYAVWSEKEHSIYDMAVLPEYRKDKNASSLKLLNEVVKKIKSIGGEWSAELRDVTSLRYMKTMASRGLVDLNVGDIDHVMSDGTKVYQVTFKPKNQSQNNINTQILTRERQSSRR